MISFSCPLCSRTIETDEFMGGKTVPCPHCGGEVSIPAAPAAPAPPAVPAAPSPEAPPVEVVQDVPRCDRCGARRKEGEVKCVFCGAVLEQPAAPASGSKAPSERSSPIVPAALAVVVLLCAAWMMSSLFQGEEVSAPPEELCRGNLRCLWDSLRRCAQGPGGLPKATGGALWKAIAESESVEYALSCPASRGKAASGAADFRGPSRPWQQLADDAVAAMDLAGNHSGGANVLLKNGQVEFAASGTPLYTRAMAETRE